MIRRCRTVLPLAAALAFLLAPAAQATHPVSPPDPAVMDDFYKPVGHFKPGGAVPSPTGFVTDLLADDGNEIRLEGRRFNPSGEYNAFDTNVFEVLALPWRAAGDTSADDEYGNGGDDRHGFCIEDRPNDDLPRKGDLAPFAGECPNHQLEYSAYYEETLREILGDFGVTIKRWEFENPGSGNTQAGRAINTAAIVPGADHPEDVVVVSGHYDQTDDGPASAWDSAEGHAQVIRIAKIMADYWRATDTRPSATVVFVPWDGEESGTLGSLDYVTNNMVPGRPERVRGYFNTDPCAGGYPAFRNGVPPNRIPLSIQIANPDRLNDPVTLETTNPPASARPRFVAFNQQVPAWVEQVFDYMDDELQVAPGAKVPIFVSPNEGPFPSDIGRDVQIDTARDILFSSDWANFEEVGVPFMNPGPAITGPSTQGDPSLGEAVVILHSPLDNIQTVNSLSSIDQTGNTFSEGWMKGMEMCAHLLAWPMLQPSQGGAQTANGDVVAYFEALPNEAAVAETVKFDAAGSYQYASADERTFVDESQLEYSWDFGDGTTATGQRAEHAYAAGGVYDATLTVRNPATGRTDAMEVPITVIAAPPARIAGPVLDSLPATDNDGSYRLEWDYTPPEGEEGFVGYGVEEARDLETLLLEDAEQAPELRWEVATEDPKLHPWQKSDSSTRKLRGNQSHTGGTSFWTGVSPQDYPQALGTVNRLPGNIKSTLTLKDPITVGQRGLELSFWSLFQSEGDDQGRVEVAIDDGRPRDQLDWQSVDVTRATLTGATDAHDPAICSFRDVETFTDTFLQRRVRLDGYEGNRILIRFNYALGPDDRALSNPCGWYVDDVELRAGTFTEIGRTTERSFEVAGRTDGRYTYRILGKFDTGASTRSSNFESVEVDGVPAAGGNGEGGGTTGEGGGTTGEGGGTTPPADQNAPGGGSTEQPGGGPPPSVRAETLVPASILAGGALRLRSAREIPLMIDCPPASSADCRGALSLYAVTRGSRSAGRVKLGGKRFQIAAGRRGVVRVRVRSARRALLARGRRLRVSAVAVTRSASGAVRVSRESFFVRAPRARRRS